MTIRFITGLSGVGKSSVLSEMKSRGYKTVDLDYGCAQVEKDERLLNKAKIKHLIHHHQDTHLILVSKESNQRQCYPAFDEVVFFRKREPVSMMCVIKLMPISIFNPFYNAL